MAEPSAWHGFLSRFICRLYFHRITVINPEKLPRQGPVLFVGLHRNGAVDGFVYHKVLPQAVFLVSTQLRRSLLGRVFFSGIEVSRAKDGPGADNAAALERCLGHLHGGGQLFVFPEGTSSLGPRHLPFKSGAARLALDGVDAKVPLFIVPLGVFYEEPWAFQSDVEVVVGDPVNTEPPEGTPLERLRAMKVRIAEALEELGTNVESEEHQDAMERLAYVSTLGTRRSYWGGLKAFEKAIPAKVLTEWEAFKPALEEDGLLRHQGVPLFPMRHGWLYVLALAASAPVVLAAIAMNFPVYAAAWWAGRRFPDGRNVISLWKVLVGVPAFLLWFPFMTLAAFVTCCAWCALGYALVTLLGIKLYYRTKKLAVAVNNGLRRPDLRDRVLDFREAVLRELPDV